VIRFGHWLDPAALSAIHRGAKRSGDQNKEALSAIHRGAKRSGDQNKEALSAIHREAGIRSGTAALSLFHMRLETSKRKRA